MLHQFRIFLRYSVLAFPVKPVDAQQTEWNPPLPSISLSSSYLHYQRYSKLHSIKCKIQHIRQCILSETSNMTSHHQGLVTQRRHDILVLCAVTHSFAYWTLCYLPSVMFFIIECGSHAFSALCLYSKIRHHPHSSPPGLLCAKFRFWRSPRC